MDREENRQNSDKRGQTDGLTGDTWKTGSDRQAVCGAIRGTAGFMWTGGCR